MSITDPKGNVTTNTYDLKGNLLTTKDSLGEETKYKYTNGGLVESITDALGNVISFSYDSNGNPTQETDALGNITKSTYDSTGNRLTQTVTRGAETLTTSYIYDKSGRATKTTYPDGSSTETIYNSIGKVASTKDSGGRQTSYDYDEMGPLSSTRFPDGTTERSTYDAEGRRITSTDRLGNVTSYNYDKLGRLVQTTYADGSSTITSYNALGRVNETKDANGFATNYEYDEIGRRTKTIDALGKTLTFSYDANGNTNSQTDALGRTTTYTYDQNNRQTQITFADGTAKTFTYDAQGKKLSETDPAGKRTSFEYDKLGRLVKVTDAIGKETSYSYNEVGQQTSQTDANTHTTTYEYDKLGRRTKRKLPLGQEETYSYNSNGTLASLTDFNGKTTTYTYDEMSRVLTKTPDISFGKSAIVYTYDSAGKRLTMTDESGVTNYSYDNRGRLLTKQTPQGTLSYTYDNAGNLLSTRSSNANGISEDFSYDKLNRLESVRDNNLGAANETKYNYDSIGNLLAVELPNGVHSNYIYDKLNRLTNLNTNKSVITSYGYKLGSAGNRLSVAELGRTVEYKYDDIYRLTREAIGTADISYNYDAVGNRLSRTSTVAGVSSTTETYDNNDRISSDSYDENGSTTTSNGKTYSYDFEQRLISVTGGGVDISIVYDGDGNRISKSVTTGGVTTTTKYLVDENNPTGYAQVAEEIQNKKVVRQYTYGNDLISENQIIAGSWKTSFYGYDGHGSVRFLTDSAGSKTDSYDYDAFGILISKTGTTPNVYLYAGEQWDGDLGLYYNRARYLNTNTGRFFTKDSFEGNSEDRLSLHKYLYSKANPIGLIDPSGNNSIADISFTATIRQALAYSILLHGITAAYQISEGASIGATIQEAAIGVVIDVAMGATFTGLLKYAPRLFQLRSIGQAVQRATNSVWNLDKFSRGRQIEQLILGRSTNISVSNFPVIDDFSNGIATSIKSMDLTSTTYQNTSAITSQLTKYAKVLNSFNGKTWGGLVVEGNQIQQRVLLIAIEDGAATSNQAQAIKNFVQTSSQKYPNIRISIQVIK